MRIGVVGLGAAGLPLATILGLYHEVIGVDVDSHKVEGINKKTYWGGLEKELKDIIQKSKLTATENLKDLTDCEAVILALPSNSDDYNIIESVIKKINEFYKGDIIISSTIPPGLTRKLQKASRNTITHVPMRTFEGNAVKQFHQFPHIIGVFDKETYKRLSPIYEVCGCETLMTSPPEKAELTKLFSNVFRQTEIAIANELSLIAELYGIDPKGILEIMRYKDPYRKIKKPGIWGGYCLPKDTKMLIKALQDDHGYTAKIPSATEQVRRANDVQAAKRLMLYNNNLTIGIEGVANKPLEFSSPDIRGSPVIKVVRLLVENGRSVKIYDPNVPKDVLNEVAAQTGAMVATADEIKNCDVWARFEGFNLKIIKRPEN